jgi:hypothetical protein
MPPTMKKKLELEQRRKAVAANILAGLNYRDIAEGLGVSLGTIARDAQIMLERMRKEQVQTVSEAALVDLRRIDVALNAIWDDVKSGKLLAIDRMERLLRRRAEMLGYDQQVFNVNLSGEINIEAVRDKRWQAVAGTLAEALEEEDGVEAFSQAPEEDAAAEDPDE